MLEIEKLTSVYFDGPDEEVFTSIGEQAAAWGSFLDMICALAHSAKYDDPEGERSRVGTKTQGYDILDNLLPARSDEKKDIFSEELNDLFYQLYQKGYDLQGTALTPLSRVMSEELTPMEIFSVIAAFVAGGNRKYEKVFSGLSEDTDSEVLTLGLCLDLAGYFLREEEREIFSLLDPESFANRCIFKKTSSVTPRFGMAKQLILKDSVQSFLLSGKTEALNLLEAPEDLSQETICRREVYEEIRTALADCPVIELTGSEGCGRRYLLSCGAKSLGRDVIFVDMKQYEQIIDEAERNELESDIIFGAKIAGMIPYLWCPGNPEAYAPELRRLYAILTAQLPTVVLGSTKPVSDGILGGLSRGVFRIAVPDVSAKEQEVLWQDAASKQGISFGENFDLSVLVSKYVMSPGRIMETMANVASLTKKGDDISPEVLEEQIRRSCSVQFGESATRLNSGFTWEDLMISPESEKLLRMAADRVRYRSTVNEEFGFAKKLPYGKGVAIVFYGPPGTGKTMAAQVLANELGLDIYRIDLSQVSSKYIGETEKNLGAVFDAAKNSNAILFFDEADSLFSKRTEVSSSNDKYANAETSYLLQKIEEYSGVSVLATNNMQNFDAAFRRRMTFIISIEAPDEETRVRLWESVFPQDAPLSEEVDLKVLAHAAPLTGSSIKSAATGAAYLAAAHKRPIGWEDLITAVDLEGIKNGTMGLGSKLREVMISGID
ncbi:MAG: AAA family ATPase [Lachnospiraceae bacterium]|nr:AAA family ATPase [Lachnospiraceae bacterium]